MQITSYAPYNAPKTKEKATEASSNQKVDEQKPQAVCLKKELAVHHNDIEQNRARSCYRRQPIKGGVPVSTNLSGGCGDSLLS